MAETEELHIERFTLAIALSQEEEAVDAEETENIETEEFEEEEVQEIEL